MSTATLDTPLIAATVHPVRDHADADDFLEWLQRPRRVLAVDTETTGLDFFADVRLMSLGVENILSAIDLMTVGRSTGTPSEDA